MRDLRDAQALAGQEELAAVFGLYPKTAIRYAENARRLLVTAAGEHDPSGQPSRHVMHS